MSLGSNRDPRELLAEGRDLVEREAMLLDAHRWDEWLQLFTPDCVYWMPTWKSDDELTADPQRELSHFYYASRAGLEDRIIRIKSERSPASTPLPRSTHLLGSFRLLDASSSDRMRLHCSWVSHVFFPRARESHAFFGTAEHELVRAGEALLIARKTIVLQNDYIPTMLDIYCV